MNFDMIEVLSEEELNELHEDLIKNDEKQSNCWCWNHWEWGGRGLSSWAPDGYCGARLFYAELCNEHCFATGSSPKGGIWYNSHCQCRYLNGEWVYSWDRCNEAPHFVSK